MSDKQTDTTACRRQKGTPCLHERGLLPVAGALHEGATYSEAAKLSSGAVEPVGRQARDEAAKLSSGAVEPL